MKAWACTLACGSAVLLAGCATGTSSYGPPTPHKVETTKVVNQNFNDVWAQAVPSLGKQFFVINNLDKSSGLINLSYSGDPERYIDCGTITTEVTNARGRRDYFFPASRGYKRYEAVAKGNLFEITRGMKLDGRVNVIFEKQGANQTRVSVSPKFVVQRTVSAFVPGGVYVPQSTETISFTANHAGAFPPNAKGDATTCISTGALEKAILDAIP